MPITQFASQQIVQGAPASLTAIFVDQDGEPRTPASVSVHIVRSDGTDVVAATAATINSDNEAQINITPAQTALLDVLTCTWTETAGAVVQTVVEVCGGRYFTINEARSIDKMLQDVAKYPDEDIKRVRTEVEIEVERITGRSFVPRFRTDQTDAADVGRLKPLQLSQIDLRTIRSVKVNGTTYASTYWELTSNGRLAFGTGVGLMPNQIANGPYRHGNLPVLVTVDYEYGWPSPPEDLKRAMVTRLRSRLLTDNTGIPSRATSMTVDGSTFSLSTPGVRGALTGIPDVDSVYDEYTRRDWKEDFVGSLRIV